ncbi:DUF6230 family protein [Falsibacillus pallidus]|uniref:Uncharacterized protein n=1 Tax=Falsibacillus pallidus TaxID=493781 RepID=A0A370G181_9BACI|nr:DUF6230 family protein [Falsibacillus pallidus]RDI36659.1 hypothetical protein DFR59_12713 [Falsibacillus pallidus]
MNEKKREINRGGRTSKKVFWTSFLSGMILLGALLVSIGLSGVAYAVPLAGVGDFYVEFDNLEGDGYTFYPKMGETSSSKSAPQGTNLIEKLTIKNLKLYKDFKVGDQWLRVEITASKPVQITGLQQDASLIQANAKFSNLVLKENYSSDWTKQFKQSSSHITLGSAKLKTHYLFQKTITMNGMKLTVHKIDKK